MGEVLITGGTGVLGSRLARDLRDRGREVRVLSRSDHPSVPRGVSSVQGDVRTGVGLDLAVSGVDCIVHAATSPFRRPRLTEVVGVTNVLNAAARAGTEHVVYVSIVGVDSFRFPVPYYRAKHAAEQIVEQAPMGWTIQRITQFHELLDRLLRLPIAIRTPDLSFQPIAAADAARRIADLVEAGPAGRADDIGGPEILGIREMADQRREVVGRRTALIPVPSIGPLSTINSGALTAGADRSFGTTTWRAWLRARGTDSPEVS